MTTPKRHHYIPELILKRFADAKGLLQCCRRNGTKPEFFESSPKNAFVEKRLYSKIDSSGNHDASVEKDLSSIESDASTVISKIVSCALDRNRPRLSRDERSKLALFRCHHQRRVPMNRQLIEVSKTRWLEEIPHAYENYVGRPVTDEERARIISPEYWEQFRQSAFTKFVGAEPPDHLLNFLTDCPIQFGVIAHPKKSFVIGDWIEIDEWFPVHRSVAFKYGDGPGALIEFAETTEIRRINEHTVRNCQSFAGPSKKLVRSLANYGKS